MLNSLGAIQHTLLKGDLTFDGAGLLERVLLSSKIDTYASTGIREGLEFVRWIGFETIQS